MIDIFNADQVKDFLRKADHEDLCEKNKPLVRDLPAPVKYVRNPLEQPKKSNGGW